MHNFLSPMKMEQTECSETSAYKIHTPGNYPEDSIQHSEHGESLKSRISPIFHTPTCFDTIVSSSGIYALITDSLKMTRFCRNI